MAAESALGQNASSGNGGDGRVRQRRAGKRGGRHREEPHGRHSETWAAMTRALARMRDLPEALTFAGFCKLTRLSNNAAAVCLTRWKNKGLVDAAGERARLYFNKLKCNEVDGSLRIAALLFEYPSAMLCGESVLHAAGWITQIPACLSVAVISRPSYVARHGFDIRGRPVSWFKKVRPAVDPSPDKRIYGRRSLPTPLALADL